jgi:hypothetical protein
MIELLLNQFSSALCHYFKPGFAQLFEYKNVNQNLRLEII